MRQHGAERPVVVGEYNGPTLFELPQLDAVLQQTMVAAFVETAPADMSTVELAARAATETPERRALRALYQAMPDLPAPLQMFMAGCPPELDDLRDRINCREIVTRNLLALSARCAPHGLLAPGTRGRQLRGPVHDDGADAREAGAAALCGRRARRRTPISGGVPPAGGRTSTGLRRSSGSRWSVGPTTWWSWPSSGAAGHR